MSRIIFEIVPNLNSNFVALQSGAVDAGFLTPDNVERAARISGIRVVRTPENGAGLLYLRTQTTPTNDVRVRRAIAHALDPSALSNAWRHEYRSATSFLPPPVVRWRSAVIPAYPHPLSAANRELEAASWHMENGVRMKDGEPLRGLIGADADNPINVRIATLVQSQLAAVGMSVSVKTNPTRVWFRFSGLLRSGSAAMVSETWLGGSDPEQSVNLRCAEAAKGGDNHSFYCSRGLDADQARAPSEAQRDRDFDEMQRLVHDDVPIIPLYYEVLLEGINKRVSGYQKNMLR
ncbi:MAG: ABC transporter substrate-binding protein [Vulcanimicrobiaceae bacterium]